MTRTVAVVPLSVRPGWTSVNVPPPELARPVVPRLNVKPRVDGVVGTVYGPPL